MIYRNFGKRLIDIFGSVASLLVLLPLLILTALVILLEDGKSPFFRQQRVGRGGRTFTITKFRSMPVGTPTRASVEAASISPTRVGAVIRRTNIDELPQLFNILLGDMSLVGPRPALPTQVVLNSLREQGGALSVRPGLTGLAQVSSYDGMPEAEKAYYDCQYAREVSFIGDVTIVLRTFLYLVRKPPVY